MFFAIENSSNAVIFGGIGPVSMKNKMARRVHTN
jgi:hypothetical protein